MGRFKPDPTDPVANEKAMTRRQRRAAEMKRKDEEIERLRVADSAKSKYIKELRVVNRALNDAQTNNRKRIEDLECEVAFKRTVKGG